MKITNPLIALVIVVTVSVIIIILLYSGEQFSTNEEQARINLGTECEKGNTKYTLDCERGRLFEEKCYIGDLPNETYDKPGGGAAISEPTCREKTLEELGLVCVQWQCSFSVPVQQNTSSIYNTTGSLTYIGIYEKSCDV